MTEAFIISFKLRNTYRVNSIIYSVKQLPLIKKVLSDSLYESSGLKTLANIISIITEIVNTFIGKFIYMALMVYMASILYSSDNADIFIHIFTFLTLCGGLLNTYMFNPTKDKYYAIIIMNMDAKKYTLSNYYYQLIRVFIGFLPFTLLFGILEGVSVWIALIMPVYVVSVKIIVSSYAIWDFKRTKKAKNENIPSAVLWALVALFLLAAYALPLLDIIIRPAVFAVLSVLSAAAAIYGFLKINSFEDYRKMYKQLLTQTNVYRGDKQNTAEAVKKASLNRIELDKNYVSNKSGFAYFHELFVQRHRKILTKSARLQAAVCLVVLAGAIAGIYLDAEFKQTTNRLLLTYIPYFVFIMYCMNRGTTVTQAMFMNCDHSMLTYRIYRTPKVILGIFKERLKTLIKINLLPASVIAAGLTLLLYISGGTDNVWNYPALFLSIEAMSIFFSVHYLVMYYLLQPYNADTEIKSSTYKVVQILTYVVSYICIEVELPTVIFGMAMVLFCAVYCIVSLFLAYKYAPKTFRIRR